MTTSDASVIERAADMGINLFDTARVYQNGNNERMVGAALKGRRKSVLITSKTQAKTRAEAVAHLETSLKELQTDYLDVWYLHNRNTPEEINDELLETQAEMKKAGKIRFAGISTHLNMDKMLGHIARLGRTDVVLTTYNFTMAAEMTRAIEAARGAGLGIVAMKVLAGGFARIGRGDRLYGVNPEALTSTLKKPGAMQAAIKWSLANKSVDTAIVCMTDNDQLEENFAAMGARFSEADKGLLAAQLAAISPLYCRMCGTCTGACPQGVQVADKLRILAYADGYGQFGLARERYQELAETSCAGCGSCAVRCPNGVDVPGRLRRAEEMLA